jgi:hypothetical protein
MVAAFVERVEFHARSTPRWKMRAVFGMASFFRARGMGAAILGKGEWFERLPAIADSGNH